MDRLTHDHVDASVGRLLPAWRATALVMLAFECSRPDVQAPDVDGAPTVGMHYGSGSDGGTCTASIMASPVSRATTIRGMARVAQEIGVRYPLTGRTCHGAKTIIRRLEQQGWGWEKYDCI
jgi:hypothetical protein